MISQPISQPSHAVRRDGCALLLRAKDKVPLPRLCAAGRGRAHTLEIFCLISLSGTYGLRSDFQNRDKFTLNCPVINPATMFGYFSENA